MSLLSVSSIQNTASATTNLLLNTDGSTTVALYNAAVAPVPTQTGTLWYDASGVVTGDSVVVIWDGTAWVAVGASPATLAEAATGVITTKYLSPETGVPKDAAGMTGAALLPSGTTGQRPAAPAAGMTRLNTDTNPQLENFDGTNWAPIGVITSNLTLNVATTGNDATGLGTAAAPWATPHKAMSYLSNYAIAEGVVVTVSVADGAYTFTTPLNLNHPDGDRIVINGGTTTGVRPTGAALNGGGVVGNTAGTEAFNDALLKAYYNTQWQFNGCNGLVCSTGGNVTVNTVLIRGDGTSPWGGVVAGNYDATANYASSGGINLGDTVAVHNFANFGILTNFGGSIVANNATATNNGANGIQTNYGGSIVANNATATNNSGNGILTNYDGSIRAVSATASNNGANGIQTNSGGSIAAVNATASNNGGNGIATIYGGSINAPSAIVTNNGGNGILASFGGSINAPSATASNNAVYGILTDRGGSINAGGATASNNGVTGILTSYGGSINAPSAIVTNNTLNGIATSYGGSINAPSATATGNGSTDVLANRAGIISVAGATYGTISPALNTVGNLNAATST